MAVRSGARKNAILVLICLELPFLISESFYISYAFNHNPKRADLLAILGEEAMRSAISGVQQKKFLEIAASFAGAHNERRDESEYPRSLRGGDIPIEGCMAMLVHQPEQI